MNQTESNDLRPRQSVTVEDLLKLKRMERPSQEFWSQFERELRAKQLAAIVNRRPWWHRLSRPVMLTTRFHAPIGAVAVLALTWVSVRQFDGTTARALAPSPYSPSHLTERPADETLAASASDLPAPSAAAARSTARSAEALVLPREDAEPDASASTAVAPARQVSTVVASHLVPAPSSIATNLNASALASLESKVDREQAPSSGSATDELFAPSARLITTNMAVVRETGLDTLHRFLGGTQDFAANASVGRRMVDPMVRMNPVSEERRSRLLAPALPASSAAEVTTASLAERTESRLSSDRLYDSVSRYGVDGHSISIKF